MTASKSTPSEGQEPSDTGIDNSNAPAAIAARWWDEADYDIENADDWEPLEFGSYSVGSILPAETGASGEAFAVSWLLEDGHFDDRTVEVFYDRGGVFASFEASSEDGEVRNGAHVGLDPDEAREFAALLYQAAEEFERRPKADPWDSQ